MQFAFNLVQLLCLPLMSRTPCVPVSSVSPGFSPPRLACSPSSANVLICCLVQPDGLLTPPPPLALGEDGGERGGEGGAGGRKGSYLQRSPLIKKSLNENYTLYTRPLPDLSPSPSFSAKAGKPLLKKFKIHSFCHAYD